MPGPRGCLVLGGGIPACTEADPPGQTAIVEDGTHPTGIHFCFQCICFSMTHVYVSEIWRKYTGVEGLDLTPQLNIPVRDRDIQAILFCYFCYFVILLYKCNSCTHN